MHPSAKRYIVVCGQLDHRGYQIARPVCWFWSSAMAFVTPPMEAKTFCGGVSYHTKWFRISIVGFGSNNLDNGRSNGYPFPSWPVHYTRPRGMRPQTAKCQILEAHPSGHLLGGKSLSSSMRMYLCDSDVYLPGFNPSWGQDKSNSFPLYSLKWIYF